MAMIDVISHGRLDCGFVRGVPMELSAGNSNPVDMKARFWEALDLIVRAWTTHDGPFNWQGKHFEYRQVNIVPRPYQQPHPPVWIPVINPASVRPVAERNFTCGTVLQNIERTRQLFNEYR